MFNQTKGMLQFLPPLKWWGSLQLYHEIKRYAHKGDKREKFIKQIIIDWYNNKIDGSGNLSKNITLW